MFFSFSVFFFQGSVPREVPLIRFLTVSSGLTPLLALILTRARDRTLMPLTTVRGLARRGRRLPVRGVYSTWEVHKCLVCVRHTFTCTYGTTPCVGFGGSSGESDTPEGVVVTVCGTRDGEGWRVRSDQQTT